MSINNISYSYLKDFDWSIRLSLSSDKLSTLRQPLVLIQLTTQLTDGSIKEVILEMDNSEVKEFLKQLKQAQNVVKAYT